MMKSKRIRPLSGALGAAFIASTTVSLVSAATAQPFTASLLGSGYELANFDQPMEQGMDAGGNSDGGNNQDAARSQVEGRCGAGKDRAADRDMKHDSAASAPKSGKEGKCGDAKCGANKGR